MRQHYDAELAELKAKVVTGHGYEPYPVLFNRTVAWDQKASLVKGRKQKDADAGEDPGSQRKGRSKAANAIESVNRSLRKISKNRGVFPHQEALLKLYYLALDRIAKKWTLPIPSLNETLNRFAIEFGCRVPKLA